MKAKTKGEPTMWQLFKYKFAMCTVDEKLDYTGVSKCYVSPGLILFMHPIHCFSRSHVCCLFICLKLRQMWGGERFPFGNSQKVIIPSDRIMKCSQKHISLNYFCKWQLNKLAPYSSMESKKSSLSSYTASFNSITLSRLTQCWSHVEFSPTCGVPRGFIHGLILFWTIPASFRLYFKNGCHSMQTILYYVY